ncbi:hypothetical protein FRC06_010009 [Ceratobasidium sp. 370]|nr:hypothetical protein FRC06_010009 [Ceratobasidium sp. 370]
MEPPLSSAEMLLHVAYHVFLPPQLPQQAACEDNERRINHRLARSALDGVDKYRHLVTSDSGQWVRMSRMLSKLAQTIETPLGQRQLQRDMSQMRVGGTYL